MGGGQVTGGVPVNTNMGCGFDTKTSAQKKKEKRKKKKKKKKGKSRASRKVVFARPMLYWKSSQELEAGVRNTARRVYNDVNAVQHTVRILLLCGIINVGQNALIYLAYFLLPFVFIIHATN